MCAELRHAERIAKFYTPLGDDFFVLTKFEAEEGLSELFTLRVEAISSTANANLDSILGEKCYVSFTLRDGKERIFHGILTEANWVEHDPDGHVYRFILRPWLWLLSRRADCKIFHDKMAKDIIKDIFNKEDKKDFDDRLSDSYQTIPYCVQYRESDLNFVQRLMEYHGIYYYFEHSKDGHKLILSDSKSSHKLVQAAAGRGGGKSYGGTYPFLPRGTETRRHAEHLVQWTSQRRLRTGKFELKDYDFKKSTADLKGNHEDGLAQAKKYEQYDYPGRYTERNDGERFATVRTQAEQALADRRHSSGDAVSLFAGALMKLSEYPEGAENGEYLVVHASHAYGVQAYRSGARRDTAVYHGSYEFQKSDKRFRAPMLTPRPVIHGPQTAKVIGERNQGNEGDIDVDKYGCIFVHFHWDRDNQNTSRRVRVAQVWAGKAWGGQVIPRIGQEVMVEFLEGDPDQPIVTGAVVNDQHMPPYELPANKTQSGLKSESTNGGGVTGKYNEIKFEDKDGKELVTFHAQKDLDSVILNTERREIAKNFEGPAPARKTTVKQGDDETYVDAGKYLLKVSTEIKLVCGQSVITMTPGEIKIESPTIKIASTAKTDVTSNGIITIQGSLVKIN